MAGRFFRNINLSNGQEDDKEVAACSWVWRTGRCCKQFFLQSKICSVISIVLGLALVITVALRVHTSWDGKFPSEQCSSEWIGFKNNCYFISEEEKNWTSSQTFCATMGSKLAIFKSQEEMISLLKLLRIEESWIGLCRKGENFYWENGNPLDENLFQIRNHSQCAYLEASTSASISTSACSLPRRFICMQVPKVMT